MIDPSTLSFPLLKSEERQLEELWRHFDKNQVRRRWLLRMSVYGQGREVRGMLRLQFRSRLNYPVVNGGSKPGSVARGIKVFRKHIPYGNGGAAWSYLEFSNHLWVNHCHNAFFCWSCHCYLHIYIWSISYSIRMFKNVLIKLCRWLRSCVYMHAYTHIHICTHTHTYV